MNEPEVADAQGWAVRVSPVPAGRNGWNTSDRYDVKATLTGRLLTRSDYTAEQVEGFRPADEWALAMKWRKK